MAISDEMRQAILQVINESLTVEVTVEESCAMYSSGIRVRTRLLLEGEEISSDSDSMALPSQ